MLKIDRREVGSINLISCGNLFKNDYVSISEDTFQTSKMSANEAEENVKIKTTGNSYI